jgi:DNA-binding beta-propeller fold protein YncE
MMYAIGPRRFGGDLSVIDRSRRKDISLQEEALKKSILMLLAVIGLFAIGAQAQVPGPLKLIQTIPLPGLKDGDFDHFQVDLPGQRLFLAAEENSAIEVIDLRTNKVIHKITGTKAPHSMGYDPDSKKLFVADDGGPNQVEIFDGTTYELLGTIPMGAHPDPSIYDAANHMYYVGNGGKQQKEDFLNISVIDTKSGTKVGDIKVEADRVEAMALEKSGPRMFVNMYSKAAVAVIDREKKAVIATWSIASEGRNNGSLAFDEASHRLFIHARDPGKLVVMDSDSGKIITSVSTTPSSGWFDDATFDARTNRIYVTGVPFINIFQKKGDRYDVLGLVPTAFHSITSILVPQLNRFYLVVNHHGDTEACVQVYELVP